MSTEQAYLDIKAYFEAHVANGGVILCRNEEDDYAVFTNFALAQAWIEEIKKILQRSLDLLTAEANKARADS